MIRRAPLHLVRPDPTEDPYAEREVFATYEGAYGYIEVAAELWRLIGEDERAAEIEAIMRRAYDRTVPTLDRPDLIGLRDCLAPLDGALRGRLTDERLLLASEPLDELRSRSRLLDLDPARGEDARHAVEEAMYGVAGLQHALDDALGRGAHIVFD